MMVVEELQSSIHTQHAITQSKITDKLHTWFKVSSFLDIKAVFSPL